MIKSRCRMAAATPLEDTIKPPFGERANSVTARSISVPSRTSIGLTSTPNSGPTAWMAPNCPLPEGKLGSRMTAARARARRNLLEQFQPFPAHTVFERREAGRIAAWPCQARDEATADRIGDDHEYDRQAARRLQQRSHRTAYHWPRSYRARALRFPRRAGACARYWWHLSGSRCARCGRPPSPIPTAPAVMLRGGPAILDRPRAAC